MHGTVKHMCPSPEVSYRAAGLAIVIRTNLSEITADVRRPCLEFWPFHVVSDR